MATTAASSKPTSTPQGSKCSAQPAKVKNPGRALVLQIAAPGHRVHHRHLQEPTRPRTPRRQDPRRGLRPHRPTRPRPHCRHLAQRQPRLTVRRSLTALRPLRPLRVRRVPATRLVSSSPPPRLWRPNHARRAKGCDDAALFRDEPGQGSEVVECGGGADASDRGIVRAGGRGPYRGTGGCEAMHCFGQHSCWRARIAGDQAVWCGQ